ncbi:23 kDa integral membrane protein [Biomphalaria pfeifferi]|uniref:Tetraspanin n=1 Tax=Biomphalaria pfeifferi TaxID=112525 RepID=A0AAD8BMZ0_BIOPF|nr:23 kDa integral membrane protein [Biomphalaria pfeifferi]
MALLCLGKTVMIVLNIVFMIIGLAFTVVGALLAFVPGRILQTLYTTAKQTADTTGYSFPQSADDIANVPMVHEVGLALFILGMIFTILAFLGCCGSCSSCCKILLIGFALVMILLMIAEIVVCSLFFVKDSPLHSNVRTQLKKELKNYKENDTNDAFSQTMNLIQVYFECCGVDNSTDYTVKPRTCQSYDIGCYTKLTNVIQDNLLWAGLALGGILLLQLIEVIIAVYIFKNNKILPI